MTNPRHNLHPDVAENPHELVVYGGIDRATRTWEGFGTIVAALKKLEETQTLLVQSGKPVCVFIWVIGIALIPALI